jgi:hypothetical protein
MAGREVKPIDTPFFHGIPGPNGVKSPHALTTHLQGWDAILAFVTKDPVFFGSFVDIYPRFVFHREVKRVRIQFLAAFLPACARPQVGGDVKWI